MEEILRRFENLSRLLEQACVLVDARGSVALANDQAVDLLGASIVGSSLQGFVRHPDFESALELARTQNQQTDLVYSRRQQAPQQFQIRFAPFDAAHVFIVIADKTLEQSAERIRSEFVANVSHELRSPLSVLSGFIETLMGPAAEDEAAQKRFLPIMQSEAARMQRLIDGLLLLSRAEAEAHVAPRDQVNLQSLIGEVITAKTHQSELRNMTISLHSDWSDAASLPLVYGVYDELLEVFHNLLENAVKYGDAASQIEVHLARGQTSGAQPSDDYIQVRVTNAPPVIEARHISRLTERFYRVDEGRSRTMGGSGLGLAIVKHILNRHRGRLRISSENHETCVSVTFPTTEKKTPSLDWND
jgi:two-component system phosphate regulon sensor histidine kinase PhoR